MINQSKQSHARLAAYFLENTPQRTKDRYFKLGEFAQTHTFDALDADVVIIDTETTGFSFNHDELIQIAAARMAYGTITEWYVTFVNPGKPIPEDVAHLTNISDEMVASAPSPDVALAGLVRFVGTSNVVAHNVGFDRTFVTKRASGAALKNNIWIDSLDLARIALPRLTSHRLLDLVRAFGGPESTHRADDDVAATCMVYRVLLAAVATMPHTLVQAIAAMNTVEEWNSVYVFKYISAWQERMHGLVGANPAFVEENATTLPYNQAIPYNLRKERLMRVGKGTVSARADAFAPMPPEPAERYEWFDYGQDLLDDASQIGAMQQPPSPVPRPLTFATKEEIDRAFSAEGLLGSLYPAYEVREEQREMAQAVNKALVTSQNLVVEAGTGVGKSMAYLIPLALTATKNNITVGVATKTNALLDQLTYKELPLLQRSLGISYAALKGFNHYPCLRKIDNLVKEGPKFVEVRKQTLNQSPALAGLLSFIDQTDYDDIDALKIDYRALPRWKITTNSEECLRRRCPFFGKLCFVHGSRERAQCSDIVVTNHSLLFCDLQLSGGLLPKARFWAIDEAHGAEAEARRTMGVTVASEEVLSFARRVTGESAKTNVLVRAQRTLCPGGEGQQVLDSLVAAAAACGGAFAIAAEEYALRVKDLLVLNSSSRSKGYETFNLWLSEETRHGETFQGVVGAARGLYETLGRLVDALRNIVAFGQEREANAAVSNEVGLLVLELRELQSGLEQIFFQENSNSVYSVRMTKTKARLNEVFTCEPLDVGTALNETLYPNTCSVIYASATLAIGGTFNAFEQAMGLNTTEYSSAKSLLLSSSFNFDENMRIFVVNDIPEPDSNRSEQHQQYLEYLQEFLIQLHIAQGGSLLTLFTNRQDMDRCFEAVHPALAEQNLRLVCQKWGVSVKGLRDDFLKDEHLSLFALKSFWEGFDAPGSTLKGVVIPKLPFVSPDDPLFKARKQRDDRAWTHYSLPQAIIEVKQAVGRLIRTADDTGIVVLADRRLLTKNYGNQFLKSLPSSNIVQCSRAEIIQEVKTCHHTGL